jgi:hypothetical protein
MAEVAAAVSTMTGTTIHHQGRRRKGALGIDCAADGRTSVRGSGGAPVEGRSRGSGGAPVEGRSRGSGGAPVEGRLRGSGGGSVGGRFEGAANVGPTAIDAAVGADCGTTGSGAGGLTDRRMTWPTTAAIARADGPPNGARSAASTATSA